MRYLSCAPAVAWIAAGLFGAFAPNPTLAQESKERPLVVVSNREAKNPLDLRIFTMSPGSKDAKRLLSGKGLEAEPALSPDGAKIAYVSCPVPTSQTKEVKVDLYIVGTDGSAPKRIVEGKPKEYTGFPAWSPDGKKLAYATLNMGNVAEIKTDIWVVSADGANPKKIGSGIAPVWSADGTRLYFTALDTKGDGEEAMALSVMDADGKNIKKLGSGIPMAFSPDGSRLLYVAGKEQPDVFTMKPDGSDVTQLTKTLDQNEIGCQWSGNGKQIYFTRMPKNNNPSSLMGKVYVMDADGKNEKPLDLPGALNYVGGGMGLLIGFAVSFRPPM